MTDAYTKAGVNIEAGSHAVELMKSAVQGTYGIEVLKGIGAFGGLFDISSLQQMVSPVLVASTDGVGTKTKVAVRLGRWDTIGHDIVNHCTNDILVQGARPLFFLDYVASSKINPSQIATIVGGIAAACKENQCALLGGETAEMPGVYQEGEIDLVGTIVGVVDRPKLITGERIRPGNVIVGLPSSGAHTNGYTLIRSILNDLDWTLNHNELSGHSLAELLLAPHRSYLPSIQKIIDHVDILGMAHITGGGFVDNLPRIFPEGCGAMIWRGTWPELPLFDFIQKMGKIDDAEMFHVFNMGIGMCIIVSAEDAGIIQSLLNDAYLIGKIVNTEGVEIVQDKGVSSE